jgi:hypothetical protein
VCVGFAGLCLGIFSVVFQFIEFYHENTSLSISPNRVFGGVCAFAGVYMYVYNSFIYVYKGVCMCVYLTGRAIYGGWEVGDLVVSVGGLASILCMVFF